MTSTMLLLWADLLTFLGTAALIFPLSSTSSPDSLFGPLTTTYLPISTLNATSKV
ncbi:hypothetical protein ACHAW6_002013 [Cyclotella cf. meneghiniana]